MPPFLHHERVSAPGAAPSRWLPVLHGIYGAGRNWGSVVRRLTSERPDWGGLLVDLRQHGSSFGFNPPHTVAAAADDLRTLIAHEGIRAEAVLGHSFGGKVALVYARSPAFPLRQVWVVDSTPDARAPGGSAWTMLQALRAAPQTFDDRDAGVRALVSQGVDLPVAQWMATNLVRGEEGRLRWRIDGDEMESLLLDFFRTDAWDVLEAPPEGAHVHVVKAEESSVLDDAACARIEEAARSTGRVHLHRVQSGHWVNADNPEALVSLLARELPA